MSGQSARTIHFITTWFLVLFVIVHVAMVLLSGTWNNIRSMITGRRFLIGSTLGASALALSGCDLLEQK